MTTHQVKLGDCLSVLKTLESETVDCVVTSPPYWALRDYGVDGQLGLEPTVFAYVEKLREIFNEVKRVLKPEGTLWLNLGDAYVGGGNNRGNTSPISSKQGSNRGATGQVGKTKYKQDFGGLKPKDLSGAPWRVAFALQESGWYLRQDIIWHKPNPMPESIKDRCTKAHEYIFLMAKSSRYYFDNDAIREPCKTAPGVGSGNKDRKPRPSQQTLKRGNQNGSIPWTAGSFHDHSDDLKLGQRITVKTNHPKGKNKRSVWTVSPKPFKGAHFATFPPDLIEPCVLAGCPEGGTVLDPFYGDGTVGLVCKKLRRNSIGIEINPEYIEIATKRLEAAQ